MNALVTVADYGPGFAGWAGWRADGQLVCLVPSQAEHDPAARRVMRELVVRQGGDCRACDGCSISRS